ncbi:switch-associated protein 70 isoform X1 [Girardinichthys multiradiatus]|uniref:switch-associated protein 70 isoform X1 n=1 Tax=Girardinichthys multiradiatus TaxID=208333 RepID=UPI001FADC17E|nr:switch-associated protein 70 isoform X1 [Girardinichthys multiradiatus]
MWLREELLKAIWHAFTALDVDHRGKVSKSQLKVLSYNLYTVMKIPHDPMSFEEHFKDDDKGPLSNEGYMPYLNRYILDKVEYFLRKLMEAMGMGWCEERFTDYRTKQSTKSWLNVWELIELVGVTYFSKDIDRQILSMCINEVFSELILNILKQGYMMKKGHKRKNWTERWFVLRPTSLSYYVCEDLTEKKGDIVLDQSCCVESLLDKDGKKCLFIIKCVDKSFEISASDKKKKQEWIQAIQMCIQLLRLGLLSPHRDALLRRRELRQKQQLEQEDLAERMKNLQAANEAKQRQLEDMRMKMEEATAKAALEELRRKKKQSDLQDRYRLDLEREKMVRQEMEEQMAQKSSELEQYLQRVRELEDMYHRLEDALEDERQAKQDEEAMRKLQARLLEEEAAKRAELEQIYLKQQRELSQTEAEKEELIAEQLAKERELQAASQQLDRLEKERQGALEQYQEVSKKLERAANKTKTWKDKVAKHEGLVRLIQPGHKGPQRITNWGLASFTDIELEQRKKTWQEKKNQGAQTQ